MDNTSYINAEIYITEKDINKDIRIINSFENAKKEDVWEKRETNHKNANEEEIMRCQIKIKGKLLTNINDMFHGCASLTNVDLSNFNTQNVTNMSNMFYECYSLTNIELSNSNTQNVNDMSYMFKGCKSLTNIDLSNFNTQKVTNMSYMFYKCSSLSKLIYQILIHKMLLI